MLDQQSSRAIDFHRFLLSETHQRIEKFNDAIRQVIKPGDVVMDLGTGEIGRAHV